MTHSHTRGGEWRYLVPMGLFRRSSVGRVSADPLEDAAEMKETTTRSGRSWAAKMIFWGREDPMGEPIAIQRVRSSADPEDDGAETQLLDEERHHDEGY
jgi:hypothetical protein